MSQYLQQKQREFKGQYKYSVDCDKIKTDPTTLQVLDGSVRAKHTMIINAVVKENTGRIVVKIGKSNDIIKQEYDVAKKLEKLEGFIKMHCLFSCYNNANFSNMNDPININNFEVCQPNHPSNVDVLIMPYINKGQTINDYLESGIEPTEYKKILKQETDYNSYFVKSQKKTQSIPNVKGMSGMDAIALLENLGMKVKAVGVGKVKKQSLQAGQSLVKNTTILLELS